jgi:cyclophilin family peptidyl-prolyl cis-trans isomerase/protein-disulfide isomerase
MNKRKPRNQPLSERMKLWLPAAAFLVVAAAIFLIFQATKPEKTTPLENTATSLALGASRIGCTVVTRPPAETEVSLFPPPEEMEWQIGPPEAGVTLIEYCDFQSDGCAGLAAVLSTLHQQFLEDLRIVYRHFPLLSVNDKASLAVQAAEAAGKQDKFWQMHDLLYTFDWGDLTLPEFKEWVISAAGELGLDAEQFALDMDSEEIAALAQNAWVQGVSTGIPQTPFVLINGEYYGGPRDTTSLETIIHLLLLSQRQFHDCPPQVIQPGKQYIVTLHTQKGDIVIELFPDKAPFAVNNFVFLVQQGWYDGVTFHRVIPGSMAQGGDPSGTGLGGPGYNFEVELSDLTFNRAGLVAMANAGPGTNGCQFFITYAPAPHLDGSYTVFGEVIAGMDVVKALTPRDPSKSTSLPVGDLILSATVEVFDYDE